MHLVCKKNHDRNPKICAFVQDKDCNIREYLVNCPGIKCPSYNFVIICVETVDMPESKSISSNYKRWETKEAISFFVLFH